MDGIMTFYLSLIHADFLILAEVAQEAA